MASVWSGVVTFGLVSIPVKLYVAARPETVSFNQLHAVCHSRLRQKLYCPSCERDVERAEIVKGYKLDGWVVMDDADFEAAEREGSRALEVLEFVDAASVEPLYLERSYYLAPQEASERAYHVLLSALAEARKAAVVRFVMGTRQYHALVRPADGKLVLHTLYYADEVRELEARWKPVEASPQEVELAVKLIDALGHDFEPAKYHDEHRAKLLELIRAKGEGKEPVAPAERREPTKVINLMEALRQSVEQVKKPLSKVEPRPRAAAGGKAKRAAAAEARPVRKAARK
ncbi:MAG: Ku protein [Candidatus Rokubacteria bacterium]|nr:Ku protein [Candidatus Rokubacteria bacterium]